MINLNVNELRIGDYVGIAEFMNFKIAKVSSIRSERILVEGKVGIYSSNNHKIIPIELSKDILLKLGAIYLLGETYQIGSLYFKFYNDEITIISGHRVSIKSVHQFQNWYFLLSGGEELVFFSTEP